RPPGSERRYGLGSVSNLTLVEARQAAQEARNFVREGIDPIDERERKRGAKAAADASCITFDAAAKLYIEKHAPGGAATVPRRNGGSLWPTMRLPKLANCLSPQSIMQSSVEP